MKKLVVAAQCGGEALEYLYAAAGRFMERHPSVGVEIRQVNGNFELDRLVRSGTAVDLIHMSESLFRPYLEEGIVRDLLPFIERDGGVAADDFYGGALRGPSWDGRLAAIPVDVMVPLIFYRKEAFREAGLPEPDGGWDFEAFARVARALTTGGQWGIRLGVDIEWYEPFVRRGAGPLVAPDGSTVKGYLDSGAVRDMFRRIVDWYRTDRIAPPPGTLGEYPFEREYAMVHAFSCWIPWVSAHHPGEYVAVGLPRASGGEDTTMMYMGGFGIASASGSPDEAWLFLKELALGGPACEPWSLPALRSAAGRLGMREHPLWRAALAELEKASQSAFYLNRAWNAGRQLVNERLHAWIADGGDIESSLRELAEYFG